MSKNMVHETQPTTQLTVGMLRERLEGVPDDQPVWVIMGGVFAYSYGAHTTRRGEFHGFFVSTNAEDDQPPRKSAKICSNGRR